MAQLSNSYANITFLASAARSGNYPGYEICQAHISVVICGRSNTQWTGYAFANTGLEDMEYQEQDEGEPVHDLFAADRPDDFFLEADLPFWDAREYWLQIVAIRCQLVLKDWRFLVHILEEDVASWVSDFIL